MERLRGFVRGSVESVDVMTLREGCECRVQYTGRAVELESGFSEAMESQGDALSTGEEC